SHLQQAGTGADETPERWQALARDWLGNPRDLAAWRELATILARLADPAAEDPVRALAEFLREKTFPLEMKEITVEIPDGLKVEPPVRGRLSVYHNPKGDEPSLVFDLLPESEHDARRRVTTYTFRLNKDYQGKRIDYHPGDSLYATLPLR